MILVALYILDVNKRLLHKENKEVTLFAGSAYVLEAGKMLFIISNNDNIYLL